MVTTREKTTAMIEIAAIVKEETVSMIEIAIIIGIAVVVGTIAIAARAPKIFRKRAISTVREKTAIVIT